MPMSLPLNMAWPKTLSVSSKILKRLVYPWFSVIPSFSPLADAALLPVLLMVTPLCVVFRTTCCPSSCPFLCKERFWGKKKEARVLKGPDSWMQR